MSVWKAKRCVIWPLNAALIYIHVSVLPASHASRIPDKCTKSNFVVDSLCRGISRSTSDPCVKESVSYYCNFDIWINFKSPIAYVTPFIWPCSQNLTVSGTWRINKMSPTIQTTAIKKMNRSFAFDSPEEINFITWSGWMCWAVGKRNEMKWSGCS